MEQLQQVDQQPLEQLEKHPYDEQQVDQPWQQEELKQQPLR